MAVANILGKQSPADSRRNGNGGLTYVAGDLRARFIHNRYHYYEVGGDLSFDVFLEAESSLRLADRADVELDEIAAILDQRFLHGEADDTYQHGFNVDEVDTDAIVRAIRRGESPFRGDML